MTIDRDVLDRLCARHGVLTAYADIWGQSQPASTDSLVAVLAELDVDASSTEAGLASERRDAERADRAAAPARSGIASPADASSGLASAAAAGATDAASDAAASGADAAGRHDAVGAVAPPPARLPDSPPLTCFQPAALADGGRVWGPAIQLYALRSQRNWGIGDFSDLLTVIDQWAPRGASLVGLNPLHALFAHNPSHISPYSPSSRLRLNTLYIDVDAVAAASGCDEARSLIASSDFQARLAVLRAADSVRYPEVAALKTQVLRLLHAHFAGWHRDAVAAPPAVDGRGRAGEPAAGEPAAREPAAGDAAAVGDASVASNGAASDRVDSPPPAANQRGPAGQPAAVDAAANHADAERAAIDHAGGSADSADIAHADYRAFLTEGGHALQQHARFEALQGFFHAADSSVWGWPVWPEACRSPESPAVEAFASQHADEVDFHCWLQWLADRQLAAAKQRCAARGMAIGLYLDVAVSVDRAGSDAWTHAAIYARGASIGAPPDAVNPNGQGWGLPPLRPDRSRETGHALFTETLRAAMRHAGALRIDHVMGLMRLYWIPPGQTAVAGAYVLYPLDELVAIVARESQRQRCLVIGEDLGTVAEEIRTAMQRCQLLSYRLVYFERHDDGAFKAPDEYPRRALVAISTHDLPTLAGWWTGHDLAVRQRLGQFPAGSIHEQQLATRAQDRVRLLLALQRAGLLPAGVEPTLDGAPRITPALAEAVHAYAAGSAAQVMLVQLEDVMGVEDQANLPGTVDEHPNWRQRLPLGLEAMANDPRFESLAQRIAAIRPRPAAAPSAVPSQQATVPRATYRLQFHSGFTFDDAVRVLPYLQRLGVSHVYCSPILRARAGSTHGYDVVAHDQINPELGGAAGFERFTTALRAHGMGQLLDMVPNHMGVLGSDNAWWNDVVEHGLSSPFADYFDIDWHPVNPELDGKVLLPVLGRQYGEALDAGELALAFDAASGSFAFTYFTHRFPLDPRSVAPILRQAAEGFDDVAAAQQLRSLAIAFSNLPPNTAPAASPEGEERRRDQALLKQRLAALAEPPLPPGEGRGEGPQGTPVAGAAPRPDSSPQRGEGLTAPDSHPLAAAIAVAVAVVNAAPDKNALHALHEQQAYRLAFWRVAADEINYRRFFDINELAGLRMEDPRVFEATQGFSLDLAAAGKVDGLRIDHPDGLLDPAQYFARLQDGFARRAGIAVPGAAAPSAGSTSVAPYRPLYVVAEKIAAAHEDVPTDWPIHGTTGYRFAQVVNGVLVDTDSAAAFDATWARFAGADSAGFAELSYQGKRAVGGSALAAELTVLATVLLRIAKFRRQTRDYTFNSLRSTLAEIAACLPVYRTYVVDQPSAQDDRYIDWAVAHARRRSRLADLSIFDFAKACLRNQPAGDATPEQAAAVRRFAHRFQQFSSPVAAKGVEDTAFYRYHRLVALNEVGGDPATFGLSTRAFHGANADRQARWPDTIIATSTHDNKRSEDVRCRLDVLSEMPEAWAAGLDRWQALAAGGRTPADDAPTPADAYLLYQTVLGTLPAGGLDEDALPAYRERIGAYALKAVREGKQRSSWTRPDEAYEAGLDRFVQNTLARVRPNPLLSDLQAMAGELAWFGALNSLSMVTLKYTVPGVPDLYQGNELIDLSLVDPDNRRPVDYAFCDATLRELDGWAGQPGLPQRLAALAESPTDGRLKLWLTHRLLRLRADRDPFFRQADYVPLAVRGEAAEHVVAFCRRLGEQALVVVAGRLFRRLASGQSSAPESAQKRVPTGAVWGDTGVELPTAFDGACFHDVLTGKMLLPTGGALAVSDAFATLPVAAFWISPRSG